MRIEKRGLHSLSLYRVNCSGRAENDQYNRNYVEYILANGVVDAAKEMEKLYPGFTVWQVNHVGKLDAISDMSAKYLWGEMTFDNV